MIPLVNGIANSWNNITCIIAGTPIVGITNIEWNYKQQKDMNYGAGAYPISRGYGKKEYSGSIEIYYETLKALEAIAPLKDITNIPMFDVVVTFAGNGIVPSVVTLKACEFMEMPFAVTQGDTKISIKIPLSVAYVKNL
jgi:hypothetical protein